MPELPEVETICQGLKGYLQGRRVCFVEVRRRDLRTHIPKDLEQRLSNRYIKDVGRRGKYVLLCCDDGTVCVIHFGMSGRLVMKKNTYAPRLHDHVVLDTEDGARIVFQDPRRFGLIELTTQKNLSNYFEQKQLGLEPLSADCTTASLLKIFKGKRRCMKNILLDQRLIVGLGNIYVNEILFAAGISPLRCAKSLSVSRIRALRQAMRQVLTRAIAQGGTTLKDYIRPSGTSGFFQHELMVYGRMGLACPRCNCDRERTGGIVRIVQAQRSTFYCPRQQQ